MNLLAHLHSRLVSLGIDCTLEEDGIVLDRGSEKRPLKIRPEPEWEQSYTKYKTARSLSFDATQRVLIHNNSFEVLIARLAPSPFFTSEQYTLTDNVGNSVNIGQCSHSFALAFLDSPEYDELFRVRIQRRIFDSPMAARRISTLLWTPITATYSHKGRKTPAQFQENALHVIRSCLFKIAAEQHDCLAVWKPRGRKIDLPHSDAISGDDSIPRARYDEDVVSFYKVAKASPFPSQSFLAYYHVLEFYFLRVAETKLHDRLASLINNPSLKADKNTLDKLISLIRGQDLRNDETEMLRNVLDRYIPEHDVIEFISDFEARCGEKIYSKRRRVFGEDVQVNPMKDHAIANAAKTLKHIRNAIVHSSDRYKREDCHIPLSESEEVIKEFVPLVRFFAERIIYGSAC
ncbi:hypothetical protein [Methyloversatilis sp.]|uniref:hypothetical protein n=1 Tax=Methyloversatilis sp. TaxID=2569862 RepID=UPI003F6F766B